MLLRRRILRRLAREEAGVALVLAIAVMSVLALTTSALLLNGVVNQHSTTRSAEAKQAFQIAQTGLAYAEGIVYEAAAAHTDPTTGTQTLPAQPGGGTGTYWASVAGDGVTWTMWGTGTVGNVTKTVWAQANVPSPVTTTESGVWNYVYADAAGTSCATTVNGNVTISVPILVRGDLCLGGSLKFTGAQLYVGGNLSVTGSAKIGSDSQKISTLEIGLTPSSTSTCNGVAPGTGGCDGSHSPIYAASVSEGMSLTPQMPCIGQPSSLDPQCTGSNDGTWSTLTTTYNAQAGLSQSGCPANLFDNDSTLNNSDTSISSVMLGNTAYDCVVGPNEISWTPSTHSLYVKGTLYFDGSLSITRDVVYSGQASLYFTGGVSTNGSPSFCGITNCTTSWNPDTNGIIFVAGCWADSTGSSLITSSCVGLSGGSTVQFGVYCTTQYTTAGGSSNMGPVLANSLNLGGGAQTLIPFHYFPPGTPLSTSTSYLPASAPSSWSG